MIKPITPSELPSLKEEIIPDAVIKIVNEEIAKAWDGQCAIVKQEDLVKRMKAEVEGAKIFSEGWLNIESIYEEAGWSVRYDKPGFNEFYGAFFEFRKSGVAA